MEKYKIVQLCDGITQEQAKVFMDALNDEKYFIYKEYKFVNNAIIVLKLKENEGVSIEVNREKLNDIIIKQSRQTPERNTSI